MKRTMSRAFVAILMAFVPATAFAQNDPMAAYYGNTLTCEGPTWQCHLWFKNDGTYRQFTVTVTKDGTPTLVGTDGRWSVSATNGGTQLCRTPSRAVGTSPTLCETLVPRRVGETWTTNTAAGIVEKFSLMKGHEHAPAWGLTKN